MDFTKDQIKTGQLPAIKLLIPTALFYLILHIFNPPLIYISILSLVSLILFTFSFIKKYRDLSFIAGVVSLSFLLFLLFNVNDIKQTDKVFSDKKAILKGNVDDIIFQDESIARMVIEGNLDIKQIPEIDNKFFLTVFKFDSVLSIKVTG